MTWVEPWDQGIRWRSELVTPPDSLIVDVARVRSKVLRVANDGAEDTHIEDLIGAATAMAEEHTGRALMPQTWRLILSGFPSGKIVLPRPPLVEITSFTYIDSDGTEQSLVASPAQYEVSPSGFYAKASISPVAGESWPSTQEREDAVTIEFEAGFSDTRVPPCPLIIRGIELAVGEMYDIRRFSVQGVNTSVPAAFQPDLFWKPVVG